MRILIAIALFGFLSSLRAQPAPDPTGALQAQSWSGQLLSELQFVRNALGNARTPSSRQLADRAAELLHQGTLIYRRLGPDRDGREAYAEFERFDRTLDGFAAEVRRELPQDREVATSVARAEYAAHQMLQTLLPGNAAPEQRQAFVGRLARSLRVQADALGQMAAAELPSEARATRLETDIRGLATAADRLQNAVESRAPEDRVRGEFTALSEWWRAIHADLEKLPLRRQAGVRAQAARVERTYGDLARRFGAPVELGIHFFEAGGPPIIAFGAGEGGGPHVKVFQDLRGQESQSFFGYDPRFLGGVRVAVGDVDGDGVPDVVTAPGPGAPPLVRIFSGKDQTLLGQFLAYEAPYDKGVYVAVADLNKDGRANIVTGTDAGAPAHVKVFQGVRGREVQSFFAYDQRFLGGVRVAIGDVDGDGYPDLVTAPGPGMPALIRVFSGKDGSKLGEFNAYQPDFVKGAFVAVADVPGEGRDYIVTGADAGGGPHVRVLRGLRGKEVHSFFAYDERFLGGVRVAARDVDGDGVPDIITAPGFGMPSIVRVFNGKNAQRMYEFDAYPTSKAGAYVAAH